MNFRHKGSVFIKRKLFQSFFILSLTSVISKAFSIINRMVLSRLMSPSALSLYMFLMPSLSFCLTLGQLGIPSAIYRLLSHPKCQKNKTVIAGCTLSLFTTVILSLSLFVFLPYISTSLLKNSQAYYPMLTFLLFIPLVAFSGILKNMLLAQNKLVQITKTQIIEEISRIVFCWGVFYYTKTDNDLFYVVIAYLSMSVGELLSIIYMLFCCLRQFTFSFSLPTKKNYQEIISIAIPLTGTRLLHSLVSFLEPMILVSRILLPASLIQQHYAIVSGFVLSLLSTPLFFNTVIYRLYQGIANSDLYYHHPHTQRHLFYAMLAGLMLGLPFSLLFYLFPEFFLHLIYHTTSGAALLKMLAFPFLIFYLQTPLTVILYASNKNRTLFLISLLECIVETILTYSLSPTLGVIAIVVSLYAGMLLSLVLCAYCVYRILKHNKKVAEATF